MKKAKHGKNLKLLACPLPCPTSTWIYQSLNDRITLKLKKEKDVELSYYPIWKLFFNL